MAHAENTQLIERFQEFYREYYAAAIGELSQQYPTGQKSLYVEWGDLYQFDPDLADDVRSQPGQLRQYAEEALRRYDMPVDVSLSEAHVRLRGLPEVTEIRGIRADHRGRLIAVRGIVRKATDVRPKITDAAFECQRCGTLTRIPQTSGEFQEPHECQGCERQGPFRINFDQSAFVDAQKIRVQESPEGLRGGETPQSIDVHIEDDVTGKVTAGDHVRLTGILHLDQQGSDRERSPVFDISMEGMAVEIEDEQFEDMDITDADEQRILELAATDDIYDHMVGAIAPSIYGYDDEKLAMILQLFSGVTKHLPDGSRIRGDLHMLLIGDPGTGKCVAGDTRVTLADGSDVPIRELVERNLDDPKPVDDGVWDSIDVAVPSISAVGSLTVQRATKVWKRDAPDRMYHITTSRGRELEVTPSHPLFVVEDGRFEARKADALKVGQSVAVYGSPSAGSGDHVTATATETLPTVAPDGGQRRDGIPIGLDKIESIEEVDNSDEWVYDLEVAGTHNYVSNGVFSHNSQLLQYIRHIAPRSVYTSGKGSSSAGLCVTGDTLIHTANGFTPIRDIAEQYHPTPVEARSATAATHDLYSFDRDTGAIDSRSSSHIWRFPEKPCRRLETAHGKELEASVNTPVLVCGPEGLEWREISQVQSGDHVAVPKYDDVSRNQPSIRAFVEFTDEKLKPTDDSVEFLRRRLCQEFGTLRDAANALNLPEDFIYDSLSNRHLPQERLDTILDAIDANRGDIDIQRAMLRHGPGIRLPDEFTAELMYLIGLVFGDGDVMVSRRGENRGLVRISNSNVELLEAAADIIESTFDKSVAVESHTDRVPCIRLHSATIARFFSNLGVESPKDDVALDPRLTTAEHADAFLQGLFDADGSVSARTDGGSSIQFSTINDELARQVQLMLETYGVRARRRERDRRGSVELESGHEIHSTSVQTHLTIYGKDIDAFADAIGFRSAAKAEALTSIAGDTDRRGERLPVGEALVRADGGGSEYYPNLIRGSDPDRKRSSSILDDSDLDPATQVVEEVADTDLVWDEVTRAVDTGPKEVFDLTVPETHNFVGNGIVTHNTAAAVRDDFGDGQQWTLEAGALVLADMGIAAVDELDKMASDDRSALHQGLEQQEISISKAGINATLKARCSLLAAANPKYGRFDQYEPIGEQIDLEPALISRFDLIFTVSDEPDAEEDANMAEHIIRTNYAGELHTHREEITDSRHGQADVDAVTDTVAPTIDPELLRKYIAYAKRNCYPTMSDEAKERIRDFYVDLRARGADEDAPVPVTARKLEALVRLAEASARVRLSDTVEAQDAERATDIVLACLREIGMDPETGQFDADIVETGTSKSQRDRIRSLKHLISEIEDEFDEGAPIEVVIERAEESGMDPDKAEHEIDQLKQKGEVYEPRTDHLRTT